MTATPVGAENAVTSCDLHILVYEASEPVSSKRVGAENLFTSCDLLVYETAEPVSSPGFVGFATDFPFAAFNVNFGAADRTSSVNFIVDNVIANTVPNAVPEPSTLALAALGLSGLVVWTVRRRSV